MRIALAVIALTIACSSNPVAFDAGTDAPVVAKAHEASVETSAPDAGQIGVARDAATEAHSPFDAGADATRRPSTTSCDFSSGECMYQTPNTNLAALCPMFDAELGSGCPSASLVGCCAADAGGVCYYAPTDASVVDKCPPVGDVAFTWRTTVP